MGLYGTEFLKMIAILLLLWMTQHHFGRQNNYCKFRSILFVHDVKTLSSFYVHFVCYICDFSLLYMLYLLNLFLTYYIYYWHLLRASENQQRTIKQTIYTQKKKQKKTVVYKIMNKAFWWKQLYPAIFNTGVMPSIF